MSRKLLVHTRFFAEKHIAAIDAAARARGFEMVTVSELFGFDAPETSDELYVYNKDDYRNKE